MVISSRRIDWNKMVDWEWSWISVSNYLLTGSFLIVYFTGVSSDLLSPRLNFPFSNILLIVSVIIGGNHSTNNTGFQSFFTLEKWGGDDTCEIFPTVGEIYIKRNESRNVLKSIGKIYPMQSLLCDAIRKISSSEIRHPCVFIISDMTSSSIQKRDIDFSWTDITLGYFLYRKRAEMAGDITISIWFLSRFFEFVAAALSKGAVPAYKDMKLSWWASLDLRGSRHTMCMYIQ